MANSTISSGNVVTKFLEKVNREYVTGGIFGKYIGNNQEAIIQTNTDLKKLSIPLIAKLSGDGVSGNSSLSGNEESLSNYDFVLTPTHYRNAVKISDEENEKAEFNLFKEARPQLTNWSMELKRDQIIQGFGAVEAGGTYLNYGDASAANLDTWNTNNQDRVLYGAAKSNNTSGDHTTSLATIDTTNDKLTTSRLSLMRRMAMSSSPKIRPVMINGDNPTFVAFVDPYAFRDLRVNMATDLQNAGQRGKTNPLFVGGDLMWENVIIKEVTDMTAFIDGDGTGNQFDGVWGSNSTADGLHTAGAAASRVSPVFFCGAQALGFVRGKVLEFNAEKNDDYSFERGVAIAMKHDIKKMFYNNKQHGVITAYVSAAIDS